MLLVQPGCFSTGVVDVCLIPEVNFAMDGDHGLMAYLKQLLAEKGHCVICVAEGAGQVCPPTQSCLAWGLLDLGSTNASSAISGGEEAGCMSAVHGVGLLAHTG